MTFDSKSYEPINCEFHDYLEHFATLRKKVKIVYNSEKTLKVESIEEAIITDLTGGRDGEYSHIQFAGGTVIIRNDYLVSVDEIKVSDFDDKSCGV